MTKTTAERPMNLDRALHGLALLAFRVFGPEGNETGVGGRRTKAAELLHARFDGQLEVFVAICTGPLAPHGLKMLLLALWHDYRTEHGDVPGQTSSSRRPWVDGWTAAVAKVVAP